MQNDLETLNTAEQETSNQSMFWPVDSLARDISQSGPKKGLLGERSGLWREMRRIASELRPRFFVVENVSALLERGMAEVIGDLAEIGYDCEWAVLSACMFGAPHTRERVFIVGYPHSFRLEKLGPSAELTPLVFKEIPTEAAVQVRRGIWNEADLGTFGMVDGVPHQLGPIKAFGNAIVPQIAEWVGRRIIEAAEIETQG